MTATPAVPRRVPVLADLLPMNVTGRATLARDAVLVVAGAATVGLVGQVSIPLGFTPVPLTLGTFAVLLVGAALGPARALISLGLFVLAGTAGVPWFAEWSAGWAMASFGYILGYVLAATAVGALARRRADRHPASMVGAAILATTLVYVGGVPWLMAWLDVTFVQALQLGVVPFLLGDAIKAAAAAALLPAAWRLVDGPRPTID